MFSISEPTEQRIHSTLAQQRVLDFSYPEVGASRSEIPQNYRSDCNQVCLGYGSATFSSAVAALLRWDMFGFSGVRLCWPGVPIQAESVVAIVAKHLGVWSLNCCRIVYILDEYKPIRRYGFAYGTLPQHSLRGEERFIVKWDHVSDAVWYEVVSFSRPSNLLLRAAYPVARLLQRRFVHESTTAFVRGVNNQQV